VPEPTAARRLPSADISTWVQLSLGSEVRVQVAPPSPERYTPPGLAMAAMRLPLADMAVPDQGRLGEAGSGSRAVQVTPGMLLPGRLVVSTYCSAFCASRQGALPEPVTRTRSPATRSSLRGSVITTVVVPLAVTV
jgi:hypothetical protein